MTEKLNRRSEAEMEALLNERNEMERRLLGEKDRLMLKLEKVRENMEKEKERFELQQRESEAREAQMREEMEALLKESDEMRRKFQTDISSFVFQHEDEIRNVEKEKERGNKMERRQQVVQGGWITHCSVLEKMIHEKEEMLKEMTAEVKALKGTMEELKQKARDMDPEMMGELKEVNNRLNNFGPQWFQKVWKKKNNMKRRQYLEREKERLELLVSDCKAREARTTEVINVLVKDRLKMKSQLMYKLRCLISHGERHNMEDRLVLQLRESMAREAQTIKLINTLVNERVEMKERLWEGKERMELELETEMENMEKQKNQERFKLLKTEKEAMEELMVEKMNDLTRMFQAEKERLEQNMLNPSPNPEGQNPGDNRRDEGLKKTCRTGEGRRKEGKKEGLEKVDKKPKCFLSQWFQKFWKNNNIKGRQYA